MADAPAVPAKPVDPAPKTVAEWAVAKPDLVTEEIAKDLAAYLGPRAEQNMDEGTLALHMASCAEWKKAQPPAEPPAAPATPPPSEPPPTQTP